MTRRGFAVGASPRRLVTFLAGIPGVQTVFPYITATKMQTNYMGLTITELYYGGAFTCLPLLWGLAALSLARRRLDARRDLRAAVRLILICTVALAVVDCQMAGISTATRAIGSARCCWAAALAWLLAENTLQACPIAPLVKTLRLAAAAGRAGGACYNFCVYLRRSPS